MSTTTQTPYDLAQAVARELGEPWQAVEGESRWDREHEATLDGPDGERLRVVLERPDRVEFFAVPPEELRPHTARVQRIGVSSAKPPAVMVKDVKKRLLTPYREALAAGRVAKVEHDARQAEQAEHVRAAAEVLAPLGEVSVGDGKRVIAGRWNGPVSVDLTVEPRRTFEGAREPEARVQLRLHRHLLPRLTPVLAALAGPQEHDDLRAALAAQAVTWRQASERWEVPGDVEDVGDVEDDTMSAVYGEAATFLERVLAQYPRVEQPAPPEVWVVHRAASGALEVYEDRWRAEQYAEAHEGAIATPFTVMNCSAAGQFWIDSAGEDDPDACECSGEVVRGAFPGFNDRDEIQACDCCDRFDSDQAAAEAIAAVVGGKAVLRVDPELTEGSTWWVVVKDGAELTAEKIRDAAEAAKAAADLPGEDASRR